MFGIGIGRRHLQVSTVLVLAIFFSFSPSVQKDVLLFRSVLVQKASGPRTLIEDRGGLYSVKLNGPPPENIAVGLDSNDAFTRQVLSLS